ncbi:benzoate/H(+) symporter BenE family transporter [Alteromonadaceae bacterium BrNp21-10]|nr:benzoate/H(+) symporter BenE family transporter [Alteromonadaceae bacterium BrNp21-10]
MFKQLKNDISFSAISAGFIAVLVGFASSVAIIFQAAQSAGASHAMTISWIIALGLGMGLTCIIYSLYYKSPVMTAWSTPGAALLVTSAAGIPIEQIIGAFLFSGLLITLLGLSGMFDKLMSKLPLPIASAMLAGVLFQFGLDVFLSIDSNPLLVSSMFAAYLVGKLLLPRYTILIVLAVGMLCAFGFQGSSFSGLDVALTAPVWVTPEFNWQTMIGIGLPLFIVTIASQNVPGVATLRASGYHNVPISPIMTGTGITTLLLAPFGGFAFNLAAISAAICCGEESHPDPKKRYIAGVSAGVFYLLAGAFGATVVALFTTFPSELIAALAGLALLSTIGSGLASATSDSDYREAAIVTLLITASGISIWGIAAPFWALIGGMLTHFFIHKKKT